MSAPILATKLYIPPSRLNVVLRSRLIERLNEGLTPGEKLILISAAAGFGKTTLVNEWVNQKAEGGRANQAPPPFSLHPSAFILSKWRGCRWTKGITTPHAF